MVLMIVSGRSGSGKSVALRALEDMGFYCVDNLLRWCYCPIWRVPWRRDKPLLPSVSTFVTCPSRLKSSSRQ